ncbi:MAG: rubredoxin [Burkholderiales bacterium]
MTFAVALEDVIAGQTRHEMEGGALLRTDFISTIGSESPQAFMIRYDPGRVSRTHFHVSDQFQIVIGGKGKLGRHDMGLYSVHFARAYTPYGPLTADTGPEGMTFFTLRRRSDEGAQRLPESKAVLDQRPNRRPWQMTQAVSFETKDAAPAKGGVSIRLVEALKNEEGLATYSLNMEPRAAAHAPDPSNGDGQYILVLEGSLLHEGREHKAPAVVSVDAHDEPFPLRAGDGGIRGMILNFPACTVKQPTISPTVSADLKVWQCMLCAFVYDEAEGLPDEGIAPGTRWADVPDTWICPDCAATKTDFEMVEI